MVVALRLLLLALHKRKGHITFTVATILVGSDKLAGPRPYLISLNKPRI